MEMVINLKKGENSHLCRKESNSVRYMLKIKKTGMEKRIWCSLRRFSVEHRIQDTGDGRRDGEGEQQRGWCRLGGSVLVRGGFACRREG